MVESTQASSTLFGDVTSGARVRTFRADTSSGDDTGRGAAGTVAEAGASLAVGRAGLALAFGVIIVLSVEATLLADGSSSHVSSGTFYTVLRSTLASVARVRARDADSREGEFVLTALSGAGSFGRDGAMEA